MRSRRLAFLVPCALLALGTLSGCPDNSELLDSGIPDDIPPVDIPVTPTCPDGSTDGACGWDASWDGADGPSVDVPNMDVPLDLGPPCDLVTFRFTDAMARSVWVSGTFTPASTDPARWATMPSEGALEMTRAGDAWTVSATISRHGYHEYKFIVTGADGGVRWISDPAASDRVDDGFGNFNSVTTVCPSEPPPCGQFTFEYRGDPTAASVWVSGGFTRPTRWAATPALGALVMRQESGVWRRTTVIEAGGDVTYKFIVNRGTVTSPNLVWVVEPSAPTLTDPSGNVNNVASLCGGPRDGGVVDTGTTDTGTPPSRCGMSGDFDWRDPVMYFVMTDRFRDSDGMRQTVAGSSCTDRVSGPCGDYAGGDLRGVTDRMTYLANLGVTALWLSAPYNNRDVAGAAIDPAHDLHTYSGYHGYWPSPDNVSYADWRHPTPVPRVEERIGNAADLRAMITAAHGATSANGHGIKVLFDYVMKHVDSESGLARAHADWFTRDMGRPRLCGSENLWDDSYWGTRCWFTDYLPGFDYYNPTVRDWSVNDALYWAAEYGIDGYRLDAIKHVPLEWLTQLRTRLTRDITPPSGNRFYLVGETFTYDGYDVLSRYVNPDTMLDGQFDFPFKTRLCEAVFINRMGLNDFANFMRDNDTRYGARAIMSTFIGNHDIPRAIHFASRQIGDCRQGSWYGNGWTADYRQPTDATPYERLGVAFAVMLTNPGLPLIYYGDEVGLAGGGDPDNRRMMPWDDGTLNAHQIALRNRVTALARIRGQNPVLGRGTRTTLSSSADTWVYRLGGCGTGFVDVTVAINRADTPNAVDLPAGSYTDLVTTMPASGGRTMLPARSFQVLRPR